MKSRVNLGAGACKPVRMRKGEQFVRNTKAATVKRMEAGGAVGDRRFHKGCGAVMSGRRKKTRYA